MFLEVIIDLIDSMKKDIMLFYFGGKSLVEI